MSYPKGHQDKLWALGQMIDLGPLMMSHGLIWGALMMSHVNWSPGLAKNEVSVTDVYPFWASIFLMSKL